MLDLLLLRHAKSDWGDPDLADHDRDLAPRGRKAAPRMGRLLRRLHLVPDLVLCSTALRARRTWELASAELPSPPPVQHLRSLYLASPPQMLATIRQQHPGLLLLVGHDPGMHHLAMQLAATGEPEALDALRAKFPTAALAWLQLDIAGWQDLAPGRLSGFFRPRRPDD